MIALFIIILAVLTAIGVVAERMVIRATALLLLYLLASGAAGVAYSLTSDDSLFARAVELTKQCEVDLPRSQRCGIKLEAVVVEGNQ